MLATAIAIGLIGVFAPLLVSFVFNFLVVILNIIGQAASLPARFINRVARRLERRKVTRHAPHR